jgi:succinyl-diaminopimelate desuccinylase
MNSVIDELYELEKTKVTMQPEIRELLEQGKIIRDQHKGVGATRIVTSVTVNPGLINGGTKINLVPDKCIVEVDIRIPLGISTDQIMEKVDFSLRKYPGVEWELLQRREPNFTNTEDTIIQAVVNSAQQYIGVRPILTCGLAYTDARIFRKHGIPAAVYGPTPHIIGAENEFVTIDELVTVFNVHLLSTANFLELE